VTGFLRFVGIFNAAVWFGAVVFFLFGVSPALGSNMMKALFGDAFQAYSGATLHIIAARFFSLQLVCGLVGYVHVWLERLYLGRRSNRLWDWLFLIAIVFCLWGKFGLNPKLDSLHRTVHARASSEQTREVAAKSYRVWNGVTQFLNVFLLAGAGACLWRNANPDTTPRFLTPSPLRS